MEEEIKLTDFMFVVRKNIGWILLVFIIVLGSVAAYTFTKAPKYEAISQVLVTDQDQMSLLLQKAGSRIDTGTQVEIIKSDAVLSPVYQKVPGIYMIDVLPSADSNVIQIRVTSENPQVAQDAANGIADSYLSYSVESKKEEAESISGFISEQITAYQIELDALNSEILVLESYTSRTVDQEMKYQALSQQRDAKEELYNYLLSRREEIRIAAKETSSNIKVIQYAGLPFIPISPNVPMNLVIGVILGLMASLGFAYIKETMRNTFRDVKDIEEIFGSSLLGSVPYTSHGRNSYLSLHHSGNQFTESIRMLRTNVLFYLKDKNMKMISVTSPQKGDGKSTLSVNLALSLAQNDSKVLLIDADLRNPTLDKMFSKVKSGPGIADIILSGVSLQDAIQKTQQKSLDFIPAGTKSAFPSELYGSNRMKAVLGDIKKMKYDVIIFDTASLEYAESSVLSADIEGTLLVVGYDKTNRGATEASKKTLKNIDVNVFGVVVNFIK